MLDMITIGRSSVDLYGGQTGGRLEDMSSFAKYIGGSPTNMAIGGARLGLKTAVITRVGDEHMGRFIRETLEAEGVDVSAVKTDPDRLSALVILGIRDGGQFPLIFYRENCADMALCEADIDPHFIASARCIVVTGTHFSTPQVAAASFKAMRAARDAGRKVALDIDYRPNLWALGGHGDGESRFAASAAVTSHLQEILPLCDLIVGTEEEWHIAGGSTDTLAALQAAREISQAVFVCKRGALGCSVFEAACSGWQDAISVPVQKIEVFNVLGAGDGFMAGFMRGWLRDESLQTAARYANGCGALAVSRHGCAPAYPSFEELTHLLEKGSAHQALRKDAELEQLHWSTTRKKRYDELLSFAFDHRHQFEALAKAHQRDAAAIDQFKQLALAAAVKVAAASQHQLGILVDDRLGRTALHRAADSPLWIGRPIEESGQFPLALEEGPDIGSRLAEWPAGQCVKVLAPVRLDDPEELQAHHDQLLVRLADACRRSGHEFLLEIITSRSDQPAAPHQVAGLMQHFYNLGIYPDWWKLEPESDPAFWQECGAVAAAHDPHLQGIIVLGKQAADSVLAACFIAARQERLVRGFAIGRTIFAAAAEGWFSGQMEEAAAIEDMAVKYQQLIKAWDEAGG